jgi:hypothetical protein
MKNLTSKFIIGTFVSLYLMVSVISTIHVVDFFELSNPYWLAVTLAIAFELGAAASLASLIVLDKMNKTLVWALFITITLMQMQGNMYYAFKNIQNYETWSQLFNLIEEDPLYQKRILAFVSGAILPLVALGFIKSLVDYIKPDTKTPEYPLEESIEDMRNVVNSYDDLQEEIKNVQPTEEDFQSVEKSIESSESLPDLVDIIEQSNQESSEGLVNSNKTKRSIIVDFDKDQDQNGFYLKRK